MELLTNENRIEIPNTTLEMFLTETQGYDDYDAWLYVLQNKEEVETLYNQQNSN
jgi:hypothetical protein